MPGRDPNGLREARALEEIEASDPFLRLGKGAVGDQEPALAQPHGSGVCAIGQPSPIIRVPFASWLATHSRMLSWAGSKGSADGSTHTSIR